MQLNAPRILLSNTQIFIPIAAEIIPVCDLLSNCLQMANNSSVLNTTINSILIDPNNHLIQLDFSSGVRFTRHLLHVVILILFISILAYVGHKRNHCRMAIRPLSHLSHFIVSIAIIGLVLVDLLVINGVTYRIWCSVHQVSLHILLMIILASHLLPDLHEYTNQYYERRSSSTMKSAMILGFIILIVVQLIISLKWLWNGGLPNGTWGPSTLCLGNIRPQLSILILHLLDLFFAIQSLREPMFLDDPNPTFVIILIDEKFSRLYSTILRLFYFTSTSILQIFFLPGQFSATFYGGIFVLEFVIEYLIIVYHTHTRQERGIKNLLYGPHLRLKSDDLADDTRLLNDSD